MSTFLGSLFDADEAPCCFVNPDGNLAYANTAFRRRARRWWPQGVPRWNDSLASLVRTRPRGQWIALEFGEEPWHVHVQPYAPEGTWIGTLLSFTRQPPAATSAPQLERLKAEFLDTVSHELRTPLTAILGFQELLQDGCAGALTGDQENYVCQIGGSARHLLRLINDLIDLAALQAGRLPLLSGPIDLGTLAHSALEAARPEALARGIGLALSGAPNTKASGDGGRVSQVLQHLLDNALKFTPRGGNVQVSLTGSQSGPRVAVCDSGPGIPDEALDNVCDTFYQAQSGLRRT
ncbi:MAG TPA: HAMP domain-containing sensor histidine kinase, partial [Oscillatoriaceae cyanobacterium]